MLNVKWFAGIAIASTLSLLPDVAAAAEPEVLVPLDPSQGQLPESITTDEDGNIYLSMGTTIGVIDPDGDLSTFATLPLPTNGAYFVTGLKFGARRLPLRRHRRLRVRPLGRLRISHLARRRGHRAVCGAPRQRLPQRPGDSTRTARSTSPTPSSAGSA